MIFWWAASLLCLADPLPLNKDDVVAFVGGADVAAAQHTGHLESLLAAKYPNVRFRNFGWEGDTVFAQPRDYNFPPLTEHLRKAGATVIVVQFGRTEVFTPNGTKLFRSAYEEVLDDLASVTPRLVLVTPIPFEKPANALLPDLSQRNGELREIQAMVREVGRARTLPVVDLFQALSGATANLTEDGLQLTPLGHARAAVAFARETGLGPQLGEPLENGAWRDAKYEKLRRVVISKNRLWFDYWRPQNWAFLGGDRIEQPSSRDHRDPKIRWFPAEMEKFQELIAAKEAEIASLVATLNEN